LLIIQRARLALLIKSCLRLLIPLQISQTKGTTRSSLFRQQKSDLQVSPLNQGVAFIHRSCKQEQRYFPHSTFTYRLLFFLSSHQFLSTFAAIIYYTTPLSILPPLAWRRKRQESASGSLYILCYSNILSSHSTYFSLPYIFD
jgi:hypothetical protein